MAAKNKKTLKKDIENRIIKNAVNEVAVKVRHMWQDYIYQYYYIQYEPAFYTRTLQLYDSVVTTKAIKIENGYKVFIYMDATNVNYIDLDPETVIKLAAQGYHGSEHIKTQYEFYKKLIDDLKNGVFCKLFADELNRSGFNVL